MARSETHTTAAQFPNATIIDWLNIVYKKVIRKIMTEADENFFHASKTLDAVAAQSSYILETNFGQLKQLYIKPTSSATDSVVSTEIDFSVQPHDYEYFALNQPTDFPRHQIIGTSLFIAPRFTSSTAGSAGNNQISYIYEKTQADLVVGGAEATISVPLDYHHVLVAGLKPMIYSALGKTNEKNDALAEFNLEVSDMLYMIRGRDNTQNNLLLPDDSNFQ